LPAGNRLDLYAAVKGLSLFDAAVALGERLRRDIPWVQCGQVIAGGGRTGGRRDAPRPAEEHLSHRDLPRRATTEVAQFSPRKWLISWDLPHS
jgi:hypothetical protein